LGFHAQSFLSVVSFFIFLWVTIFRLEVFAGASENLRDFNFLAAFSKS